MWRSCAGLSSSSKIATSTLASAHAASQRLDLAAAEKRGRIRPGTLLGHPEHDGRAGRLGETGELVERVLGIQPVGRTADQPDDGGAF